MSGDGKPKPLNLPQADSNPPAALSRPKPLGIPDAAPAASDATPTPAPRALNLTERHAAPAPSAPQPRSLNLAERHPAPPPPTPARSPSAPVLPRAGTGIRLNHNPLVDELVEKAKQIEPNLQEGRIKGRIDTVLASSLTELLDFGQRNLIPLQATSNEKTKIASEMTRIDAIGWIERCKDASCKPPSFMDRFKGQTQSPQYYEGMLQKTRAEVLSFVAKLEGLKKSFFREIADLHLDALAMIVCRDAMQDDQAKITCENRGRTLLMAHQQAAMVQTTIEQTLMLCMDQIGQIDHLLSVTLPAWKTAFGG